MSWRRVIYRKRRSGRLGRRLLGNFSMLAMLLNTSQVNRQDAGPSNLDVRGHAKLALAEPAPDD